MLHFTVWATLASCGWSSTQWSVYENSCLHYVQYSGRRWCNGCLRFTLFVWSVLFLWELWCFREKLVSDWHIGSLQVLWVFQVHLCIGMTSQVRFIFSYSSLVICCQFFYWQSFCMINYCCQKWENSGRWDMSLSLGNLWVFWKEGCTVY